MQVKRYWTCRAQGGMYTCMHEHVHTHVCISSEGSLRSQKTPTFRMGFSPVGALLQLLRPPSVSGIKKMPGLPPLLQGQGRVCVGVTGAWCCLWFLTLEALWVFGLLLFSNADLVFWALGFQCISFQIQHNFQRGISDRFWQAQGKSPQLRF